MSAELTIDAIPHRPPFLFVDEIIEVSPDRIVTTKLADPQADFFRGHYPDQPVMPGVLICESCFQAGALLIAHRIGGHDASMGVPVLTRIQDARFKQIVRPGQTLRCEVTLDDELHGAYFLTGRVTVEDKVVVRVTFACMLAAEEGTSA
ncbi:MAG: beta-hydroxyacyl-ACP dehydratase [Planctomycetes bacterium]|nr:beta-hydroxyacyl-ACP dehydratase [Planctomycetota bacterium]